MKLGCMLTNQNLDTGNQLEDWLETSASYHINLKGNLMGKFIPTSEPRRTVVMKSGNRLDLHNVTGFDCSGTFLRVWADEGFALINESEIDYMIVKSEARPGDEETRTN